MVGQGGGLAFLYAFCGGARDADEAWAYADAFDAEFEDAGDVLGLPCDFAADGEGTVVFLRGFGHVADEFPEDGVVWVVVGGDAVVVAVDSEEVLDEVVRADAAEFGDFEELACLDAGGGDFEHDAVGEVCFGEVGDCFEEDFAELEVLLEVDDHGVHDVDVAVCGGAGECAGLCLEEIGFAEE